MKATPLISSTFASADVFLLMKFAVMAMASFPLNSLRRNPGGSYKEDEEAVLKVRKQRAWDLERGSRNIKKIKRSVSPPKCLRSLLHHT